MRVKAHDLANLLEKFLNALVLYLEERRIELEPLREKLPLRVQEAELDKLVSEALYEAPLCDGAGLGEILDTARPELLLAFVFRVQGAISILRSQGGSKTYLVRGKGKTYDYFDRLRMILLEYK